MSQDVKVGRKCTIHALVDVCWFLAGYTMMVCGWDWGVGFCAIAATDFVWGMCLSSRGARTPEWVEDLRVMRIRNLRKELRQLRKEAE